MLYLGLGEEKKSQILRSLLLKILFWYWSQNNQCITALCIQLPELLEITQCKTTAGNKGCFYKLGSAKYAICFLYKENHHNIQWKFLLSGLPAQIHLVGPFTTHWVLLKREFLDTVLFLTIFELKCSLGRQSINTHPCFAWLWCHPGEVNFTLILFATLEGSPTTT